MWYTFIFFSISIFIYMYFCTRSLCINVILFVRTRFAFYSEAT